MSCREFKRRKKQKNRQEVIVVKIQIRQGVFETNSSSMHSLCILNHSNKNIDTYTNKIDENGIWKFEEGELDFYRYPFRFLRTFEDKVKYAIADYCGLDRDYKSICEDISPIIDVVKKYNLNFVRFEFAESDGEIDTGGTDDYALNSWLGNNSITLEEFLINPRYAVICDGDEYCTFDKLIDLGLINKSKFEAR